MSSPSPSPATAAAAATTDIPTPPPPSFTADKYSFTKLILFLIFFTFFLRLCYIYISSGRRRQQSHNEDAFTQRENKNSGTGLSYDIINSYHTFSYRKKVEADAGAGTITGNGHDTTCSICISDYRESEMLRMMPHCRHYFHRECVDTWLNVNGSCPICRDSLFQLAATVSENASNNQR